MYRRDFLRLATVAGGAAGLTSLAPPLSWAAAKHQTVGLQLFTIMVDLEQDFEATLKAVAAIGYQEVETIGAFGRDPRHVRELLDRYGLKSPSQHLVPGKLYDTFLSYTRKELSEPEVHKLWLETMSVERVVPIVEEGIARAKVMGQQYLVWQILWPEQMATRAGVTAFCKALDTAGNLCAKAGLTFNFHNHSAEFEPHDGIVPYEVILATTDPKTVKLELDVYWAVHAKRDPIKLLTQNRGRYRQMHLKDSTAAGDFATPGKGIIDFPAVLATARQTGVEHYYVEYDRSDDPMAVTRDAYKYLRPLLHD
jgi:sugar phosphate isomerase/epimerase